MQQDDSTQDRTGERRARAREEHAQARAGAVPSNTAPATCKVLRFGVDSLYLSFKGTLSEEGAIRLDEARKAARSENEPDLPLAQITVLDHRFSAGPTGGKLFKYLLQDHAYRIQLKSKHARNLPLAVCKISSEFLTAVGVEQAVSQLRLILSTFGQVDSGASVSRLDLFADFVSPVCANDVDVSAWVGRAKTKHKHWVGDRYSGWSIGEGKLMARLYDKTLEIQKSGKAYLLKLWERRGWDGQSPVYRLEFQFRNEALRELKCARYSEVLEHFGGLWLYAMSDWLRLTLPNPDDRTRSRWETHALWATLRDEVPWKDNQQAQRETLMLDRAPLDKKLYQAFFASLTSFMGAKGITDPLEAARRLYAEAEAFFEAFAEYKGEGFYGQATTRAARKAMSYHLPYPGMAEAAQRRQDAAVADAYRRASGR